MVCGLFHFKEGEKLDHYILSTMVSYLKIGIMIIQGREIKHWRIGLVL